MSKGFPLDQETEGSKLVFSPLLLSSVSMGHALLASVLSVLYLTNSFLLQTATRGYALGFSHSLPAARWNDFTCFFCCRL